MIKQAPEYGKWIGIAGFAGIKIASVDKLLARVQKVAENARIQLFDARKVAGFDHLLVAALNALSAFDIGINISKKIEVEALLYASSQRQIQKAIEMLGISPETREVAAVVVCNDERTIGNAISRLEELLGKRCDGVLAVTEEKGEALRKLFKISDAELEAKRGLQKERAITELIVERVALLAVRARA